MQNHKFGRRCIAVLTTFVALGFGFRASAQTSDNGGISGRVSDDSSGRSLEGAIVTVIGSTASDATDANGRFYLPEVAAGSQTLQVEYVGLDEWRGSVTVRRAETVEVNVRLASEVLSMEAFTVSEKARGQALAVNQQKTAAGIVNVVSEETFGNMIGGNIGYALQRLPGLTVNESEDGTPNGVNIRGLESKYNSFQIDGNRMPTSGTGRNFSTSQMTADGISNIEVIKAATPDRDGDAIGGIINVKTRSAFQREGRVASVTASGVYYDKNDSWGHNVGLSFSDLYNAFGGEDNFGLSLNLSSYKTSRDYDNLDKDYAFIDPASRPDLNLAEPLYFHTNGTPQTNFRDTESLGVNLAFDLRLSESATLYFKPFWSDRETTAEKARNRFYTVSNTRYIAEMDYNTGRGEPDRLTDIRFQNEKNHDDGDLYGFSFGGIYEMDTITMNFDAFYSTNEDSRDRDTSFTVRSSGYQLDYDQTDRTAPIYTIRNGVDPMDVNNISRGDMGLETNDVEEEVYSFKADWEKSFVGEDLSGSLKFGAKYRSNEKTRDKQERNFRTDSAADGFPYASVMRASNYAPMGVTMYLEPDIDALEALFASQPNLFSLDEEGAVLDSVVDDFTAKETITAAYAMGTLTKGRHQMIAGLRYEHNTFESDTYAFNETDALNPTVVHGKKDFDVWLPGIHFRHELRKNLILRESYNRSYSRPDMDALVQGIEIDEDGNAEGGNPDLTETTSDNFDVQLEYYTERAGLYSVGLFYKDMKGFYYERTTNFSEFDASGYPIIDPLGPYEFSTVDNALGATNYGIELIARQQLYFLPSVLDGFYLSLSATFTESDGKYPGRLDEELPTYGFSDRIYYAALEYVRGKFRGQLSYRYRSDYLEGLDGNETLDDWFGANESLDWESSYRFSDKLNVFLNVSNLTDEPQMSYQGYLRTDNPEDFTTYSWRATIGATYTF
ncbi:TonB-dependent receptor [Actomonas aquatica]|uniref:TonB-dependent receptor n=1 Tax=Actomonas aquatica TaxID=2866162 RepID=A0ABZ1CFE9_9BACT|nr:TonB-dependent receptor [Opitutus sp. WL0086]WRQ89010.1 TonB-dependent receptor [Opitutus sp. WL0086]